MNGESSTTGRYRLLVISGPAVFLCKLRKSNRRRIPLNPASELLNPRILHGSMYHGSKQLPHQSTVNV